MNAFDSYILCTSPRSGSTMLCSLLAATGAAGAPESYFHNPSLDSWLKSLGDPFDPGMSQAEKRDAAFLGAIAQGTAGTGIFGLRLQRHSFDFFTQQLALRHPGLPDDAARLEAAFGRVLYVHLTRADKVAQAVSFVRARQSGLWHRAADGSELERLSPPRDPVYDAAAIAEQVQMLTDFDRDWADWFAAQQITPLRIDYDALSDDPGGTLRKVLGALGIDADAVRDVVPGTARLTDPLNLDWITRFKAQRE